MIKKYAILTLVAQYQWMDVPKQTMIHSGEGMIQRLPKRLMP